MQIGLECLLGSPEKIKNWGKCAILCNQASVSKDLRHILPLLQETMGSKLVKIFSPQHGLSSTVQDNMIESEHGRDPLSGLPVWSLYSESRQPTEAMLENVDTIIIDLQIVGCRVYTFKATIRACLEAAKQWDKKVVVLDRPNPIGGTVLEGRCVDNSYRSFVAPDFIPMRHGLTAAEVARFLNQEIGCELDWVGLRDWEPEMGWPSDRPWVLTSPNLPTLDAVTVYPGMVLLEGTNLSEGRGTGLPFQLIGSPFVEDPHTLVGDIYKYFPMTLAGLHLRPTCFMPTSGKWANEVCYGLQIHVLNPRAVNSFSLGLAIIHSCMSFTGFAWRQPPYEYEYEKLPMSVILGSPGVEKHVRDLKTDDPFWEEGIKRFIERSSSCLLYERVRVHDRQANFQANPHFESLAF
ncbi:MAG: DUF1343 domain-containing protein [Deltaproteobacteria bacterium]|nr:DUF1343 domain-containing protein [Deltaproteobacteria bacterium]